MPAPALHVRWCGFLQTAQAELPGLDDDIAAGKFERLKNWLNEKIHRSVSRSRSQRLHALCFSHFPSCMPPTSQLLHTVVQGRVAPHQRRRADARSHRRPAGPPGMHRWTLQNDVNAALAQVRASPIHNLLFLRLYPPTPTCSCTLTTCRANTVRCTSWIDSGGGGIFKLSCRVLHV